MRRQLESVTPRSDFVRALRQGLVRSGGLFRLHALRRADTRVQLAVVVPKRFVPKAVWRNACKRQVRETCRRQLGQLAGWTLVIRAQDRYTPSCAARAREELTRQLESLVP